MFNMAIIINIMRSPHTSSRLMMWWTCRQEAGRPAGRSEKPRLSGGRRLGWCVFVLRDEKIRQLSAVALSSRSAALRKQSYDLNEAVSFFFFFFLLLLFFFQSIDPSPRCSDNNMIQAELHPQEHFSPPEPSRLLYVSIMCVIPRGSSGDNRGDLLCSMRCRPWALKQKGQTQSGALLHQAPTIKWEKKTQSLNLNVCFFPLNGVWSQTETQIHSACPRTLAVCLIFACLSNKILSFKCSFL